MKTIFRLIIFSVLTPLVAFAQSKTITGTINDELGLPLPVFFLNFRVVDVLLLVDYL